MTIEISEERELKPEGLNGKLFLQVAKPLV
ncbi:hypothetical protein ABSA28_00181 [Candidatus Hepatincolaceae symbiont of Richtersius coronifer]